MQKMLEVNGGYALRENAGVYDRDESQIYSVVFEEIQLIK